MRGLRFSTGVRASEAAVFAVPIVVIALLPAVLTSGSARGLAITALLYALLAVSWNLTLGFAGVFNFGHIAFFGVGAYTAGIVGTRTSLSPWLCLLLGAVAGGFVSLVIFLPAARLRGVYAALVTFIATQVAYSLVVSAHSVTGGATGTVGIPPLRIGSYAFYNNGNLGFYYTGGILLLLVLGGSYWLKRSLLGRSVIALKGNENYAISRGVRAARQRLIIFVLSGLVAGIGGALYAQFLGVATPEVFAVDLTMVGLCAMLLGGIGRNYGPALGAAVIAVLNNQLQYSGVWRPIITSLVIIGVLAFFPRGIAGLLGDVRDRLGGVLANRRQISQGPSPASGPVFQETDGQPRGGILELDKDPDPSGPAPSTVRTVRRKDE